MVGDLVGGHGIVAKYIGEEVDDALELLGNDLVGAGAVELERVRKAPRADREMQRRVQRPRDHRDPVRVCGLVVGDDQDLGAVDASELERAYARRVAPEDVEAAAFGLGRADGAQCDDNHGHAHPGQGLDERARRVAVAGDDDVVLQVGHSRVIVGHVRRQQMLLPTGPCGEAGAEREQKRRRGHQEERSLRSGPGHHFRPCQRARARPHARCVRARTRTRRPAPARGRSRSRAAEARA